jgi:hypothetical protein
MAPQLTPTDWSASTTSVGSSQTQVSTGGSVLNSPGSSTASIFEDTVRTWLALRGVQSSDKVQVSVTSEKPPVRLSSTLPEPPLGPPVLKRPDRVVGLKRWTGLILEIADDLLTVELTPTDHEGPRFHAEFDLSLLAPDEAEAQPGDIVYLTTRFVQAASGYSTATTQLRLRRPGKWSEMEVAEITELAKQHAAYFEHAD